MTNSHNQEEWPKDFSQTWCWLYIYGEKLDPDEVTSILGIDPDCKARIGEKRRGMREALKGYWALHSSDHIKSSELQDHLTWMQNRVPVRKMEFLKEVEKITLSVYFAMPHESGDIKLTSKFVNFAAEIGAEINVSVEYWPPEEEND